MNFSSAANIKLPNDKINTNASESPEILTYKVSKYIDYGATKNHSLSILKALAVSSKNEFIYTSGYDTDKIAVLSLKKLEFVEYLHEHSDCVFTVAVDEKKRLLVSAGRDHKVIFWKFQISPGKAGNHSVQKTYTNLGAFVTTVKIARDADYVFALQNDGHIFRYNSTTFAFLGKIKGFKYSFTQNYLDVTPDGNTLLGALKEDSSNLVSLRTRYQNRYQIKRVSKGLNSFKVIDRRALFLAGSSKGLLCGVNRKNNKICFRVQVKEELNSNVQAIDSNSKGNLVFACSFENYVNVLRIESNNKMTRMVNIKVEIKPIVALCLSQNEEEIVFGGDSDLKIYPLKDLIL
jgi:WD40 repeat protein